MAKQTGAVKTGNPDKEAPIDALNEDLSHEFSANQQYHTVDS